LTLHRALAHLHVDAIQVDDRIHRVEQPGLPCLDLIDHRIGDRGNQAGRDLRPVHFFQMRLDLAHGHATRIQRQDLVVEAGPAGLVLGNQLWLEATVPITRDLDRQLAELALEGLAAAPVARVAGHVGDRFVLVVTEVLGHLRIQRPLDQPFGQLFEQAVLADQVFGLLVVGQQAAKQLVGYLVLAWTHGVSGSDGSVLPVARLHKI